MYIDCSADTQALKVFSETFLLSHALSYLQVKLVPAHYLQSPSDGLRASALYFWFYLRFEGFCKSVDLRKLSSDSHSHIDK